MNTTIEGQRNYLLSIVDTVRDPMLVLGADLRVVSANRAFYRLFGGTPKDTEECLIFELDKGRWDIPALRKLLQDILPRDIVFDDFEVVLERPGTERRVMLLNARKLYRPGNHTEMILLAMEDVTERYAEEKRKELARAELQASHEGLEEAYRELEGAYEREHRIAITLQRPLLLEVGEDDFPGVHVTTLYEAASSEAEVGGDFFDAFSLQRGWLLCAVGDASGKGLGAAARAMQVKDVLRAFAREYPHALGHITARLNDYVCDTKNDDEDSPDTSFICMVLVVVNPETGEGIALSAGAEPPVILKANGSCATIPVSGLPLGIQKRELYGTTSFRLDHGDLLMLMTDGLTEARKERNFLGIEGVTELRLPQFRQRSNLREKGKAIFAGAREFADGKLRDDACLLLLQRI